MKWIIPLLFFASMASAQTFELTDSVGTATVYWQKIYLLNDRPKSVEIINDGTSTNYLLVALNFRDTTAARTRYSRRVNTGEILKTFTVKDTVYIKASSSTISFRIGTY